MVPVPPLASTVLPAHAGMAREGRRSAETATIVLPAHAGMARSLRKPVDHGKQFSPHTRGWPDSGALRVTSVTGSPRTRGDGPGYSSGSVANSLVLPAHAGMARTPLGLLRV